MTQANAVGQEFRWAGIACAVILAVALLDWPYGYYQFMKLAVTGVSVWMAIIAHHQGKGSWKIIGAAMALLFNPVIPVHLNRGSWAPLDLAAAVIMCFGAFKLSPRS